MNRRSTPVFLLLALCLLCACLALPLPCRAASLEDGLVGHWTFDDPGNLGKDETGTNNGTASGVLWTNAGHSGGAGWFDGSSAYVNVGHDSSLDITQDLTIAAWAWKKQKTFGDLLQVMVAKENKPDDTGRSYQLTWIDGEPNTPCFAYGLGSGQECHGLWAVGYPSWEQWHHVVLTHETGVGNRMYIDGVLNAEDSEGSALRSNPDTDTMIGESKSIEPWFYYGMLDEVRIYNRALSSNEVAALYAESDTDEDGDGLPDGWEQQIVDASGGAYTSVWQVLPDADFDDDWATNQKEYQAGTDPTQRGSSPYPGGLVSYWSFDDEGQPGCDDAGENDLTVNGATWTGAGRSGGALSLAGSGYAVATNYPGTWSQHSVSLWMKSSEPDAGTNSAVFGRHDGAWAAGGLNVELRFAGADAGEAGLEGYGAESVSTATALNDAQWHHVVATYSNGAAAELWLDGASQGTASFTNWNGTVSGLNVYLGKAAAGEGKDYQGLLDEVRIYNRVLSGAEIGAMQDFGLVSYWSFDDQYDPGRDEVGVNDGTVYGATWTNAGISGGAMWFDGVNDYVNVGHDSSLDITQDLTIAAWAWKKHKTFGDLLQVMVAKEVKPDDTGRSYQLTWIDGEPNTPCFAYGLGSGQECHGLWAVGYPSWEQWHHVVLTHETGVGNRMYIDGVLNAQDSEGSPLRSNPGTGTRIGDSQSSEAWFYYGLLDEVRIYNRALSSNEVAALFGESVTDADSDGLPDSWEQQIVDASGGAYTSVWQVLPGADFDDDWATNQKEYQAGTDPVLRGSSPYPGGLVSYWSFDDEGQPGRDDAGENDLTVNGATWTGAGRSGGALSLDGDDYAVASSYPGTWSQHSVSLWMKSSEPDAGTNSALFGRHDGSWAAGGLNLELRFAGAEAGEAAFEGYGAESVSTATALNDGQWHHVVATYSNGAAAELWLDGASQGTASFAGWNGTVSGLNVYLGKTAAGEGKDYQGLLDEVRVYNRVLAGAEVTALGSLGLVSYWSFDDPNEPGRDEVGVNDGTVYGATWTNAGISGGAMWFDGVNDYINVGHDSSLDITQDLTIAAWALKKHKTFGDMLQVMVAKEDKPDDTGRSYQLTWIDGEPNTPCFAYGLGSGQACHGLWAVGYPSWEQWHHVVLTHQTGVGNRMYIDGILNAQDSEGSALPSNPGTDTRIGESQSWEPWFYYGMLDEVRIYNRALSSNEVAALFGETVTDADADGLPDNWEQQIVNASAGAYTSVWQVLPGADFDDDWATNLKEYEAGTDPTQRGSSPYPGGLVSYWSFDDEGQPGRDDAGENDLTVNGATWTGSGRSGGALSLDGDDYAVASSYPGTWSQHSVSLWMKSSELDAGTNSALFGRHDGTWAAGGLNVELRFAGAEAGEAAFEGYGAESVSTATALNDGQWHHVVATYSNGAAAELWLDGASQGTVSFAGWNGTVANLNVYLGKAAVGEGKDYEGLLDEVRVYNRVLSAAEIGAMRNLGLVSYWSFDDPNEPGRDEAGVNHGAVYGATWANAGIRGGALWFDGVNDYINVGHDSSLNITQDLTISAWARKRLKTFGDPLQVVVAKENKPDDTGRSYQLTWIDGEPNTPCFAYGVGPGQPCHGLWALGYPSWEQWHHVVLTHETGVGNRMYIDGVLNAQDSEGSPLRSNPDTDTRIGDSQSSEAWFYYGLLDEVRIYNRALSSNEVAALFGESVTDADGDGLSDSWEQQIVDASGGAYTSVWQVLPGADFDDDWATNQKEYQAGTDPVVRESSAYPDGLVSYWSFDDEGQPGRDDAGEHDLTVNGATWTGAGRSGGALSLDGDDYAVASSYPGTWSQHSVSLWMKSSEPDAGTNSALFGRHDGTWAAGGLNMELRFAGAEAGEAAFEGYGAESVSTVTALNDGQWHHLVATYSNGAAAELWLDGVSQGTAAFAGWNGTVSGLNVYLGKTAAGEGKDYEGLLDEVRIYNRVLSAAEIGALWDFGLVSYWSFDDPNEPGRDEVGVNDGTLCGATWTNAGIRGGAMWFDGVNDYINAGHDSSLNITQDLTIAAWAWKKHKTFGDLLQVMVAKEVKPDDTGRSYQLTWIDGEPDTPCFAYGVGSGQPCHGLWAVGYPSWEQWHHVVLTHETGVGNRMYIDGVLNAQDSEGSALRSNPGTDTRIGDSQSSEPWFYYGMLDEVRIYSRALSSNEVAGLFGASVTDADGDGLPDSWEERIVAASGGAYTSVWQVLPGADFDDDWATNQKEYESGTDPVLRESSPYPGGLVSYWSFDDEGQPGRDDAREHDLTVNGATWTGAGRSGGALSLDGDDYAVASSYPGTWSQHSVSLWMKSSEPDAGTNSALFGRHDGSWTAGGLNLELRFAGAAAGEAAFEGYGAESVSTATALNDGQWHHVVATYSNGAAAELWLDGASHGTASFTDWNGTVGGLNVYLGKAAAGEGKDYEGLVDEVRVYNRVLSAAEIGALHDFGLVSYWSFDDPNDPGRDEVGVNHGTVYGATWMNAGIRGGAMWFDGVNDYINIGHDSSLDITQDLTIAVWAWKKEKTSGDTLQVMLAKEDKPDDTGRSYQLTWIDGEPNTPCFAYGVGSGQPCHGLWAVGYPSWDEWHHVVLTHETGVGNRMYIDGVLSAQDSEGTALRSNPGTDMRIGDSQSWEPWFYYGMLDEVRIYSRALSSNEVAVLFSAPVTDADGDGLPDSWEQQIVDASLGAYTSVWQVLPGADFDDDWATNQKEYEAGTDPVLRESSPYPGGLVSYWSFDDEGQPGRDDAGEHDLTVNGATWTGTGRSGGALSLDGNDYAVAGDYPGTWSEHSVSLWTKSSEPDTGTNSALFGRHDGSWAAGGLNMELRFADAGAGEAAFEGYGAGAVISAAALNDGQWHHVAATYSNGVNAALWIDGALQGTDPFAGWDKTVWGLDVRLGQPAAGEGKYYEGLLDEVAVFNRALSSNEIASLANLQIQDSDGDGMPDWWEQAYQGVVMFADDFEDGNDDGWTQFRRAWKVRDGRYCLDGGALGGSGSGGQSARDGFSFAHLGDSAWSNYTFEVTCGPLTRGPDAWWPYGRLDHVRDVAVLFRAKAWQTSYAIDPHEGYRFDYKTPDGGPTTDFPAGSWLFRAYRGDAVSLESAGLAQTVLDNGTNTVFAVLLDGLARVYINGCPVLTYEETEPTPACGGVGLGAMWECGAWFDNVLVRSIGMNPAVNDADLDYDGDGLSNLAEYRAGSDPLAPGAGAWVTLVIGGEPGGRGAPGPLGYGTHQVPKDTGVTNGVTSPMYESASSRDVCTGWAGTGSVPASGATTGVVFTAATHSALTWLWTSQYRLDTEAGPNGEVDTGDGWYAAGTPVALTAAASNGYHFAYWSGDVPAGQETANPLTVDMTCARQVTAHFEAVTYAIVAQAGAHGAIAPAGTIAVAPGSNVTFTVTAEPGYHVDDVRVDGVSTGAVSSWTFKNVSASHSIEALFAVDTRAVSGRIFYYGAEAGTVYVEAYDAASEGQRVAWTALGAATNYTLAAVPMGGSYWLRAFLDTDADAARDGVEPMGDYPANPVTNLSANVAGADIVLGRMAAPEGVRAVGGVRCVTVRWSASAEPGVCGYNVYRFDPELGLFEKVNGAPIAGLSYSDTAVEGGGTYSYYVTAVARSELVTSYVEGLPSAVVCAEANAVGLWMPDYVGPTGGTVRLRINAADAAGILAKDMHIEVTYDPDLVAPLTQADTNETTVEKTALTRELTVTDNGATATDTIQISASQGSASNHVTLIILGCSYEVAGQPVPVEAAYSADGGYSWTGIKDLKDISSGGNCSVDIGSVDTATNVFVYVHELYQGYERRSDVPSDYVRIVRNGANLGGIPGITGWDSLVPYLRPYVDSALNVTIGSSDALYLFELGSETNGPNADYQDFVAYVAFTEGSALVGEGHLFDVKFRVLPGAALGDTQTNAFGAVRLYDQFGARLSVDRSDTALLLISNACFFADINGDGAVDEVGDYALALDLAAGARAPTALELMAGDIDGDGRITERDATLIKRIALGLPVNPTDEPPGERGATDAPVAAGGYELSITNLEAAAGAAVDVPVLIDNAADVAAARLQVAFNPQVLQLVQVTNGTLGAAFTLESRADTGAVTVVLSREAGLAGGSGELVRLSFLVQANAPAGAFTAITVSDAGLADEYGASLAWSRGVSDSDGGLWVVMSDGADADGDGFSGYAEQLYDGSAQYNPYDPVANPGGTDLHAEKIDTDGDGAADKVEVDAGMNPISPDLFTAYNDLAWSAGQLSVNITTLTTTNGNPGATRSGFLRNRATGLATAVTLTVDGGASVQPDQGAHPASGTDAHDAFDGHVDCAGTVSYGTADLVLTLGGLNPNLRYEVVLYSDRANAAYTGAASRWQVATLSGAERARNASSEGTAVSTDTLPDDTTTYNAGYNGPAGYLTRFTDIDPGTDGTAVVTLTQNAAGGTYSYANALMLRVVAPGLYEPQIRVRPGATWRYRKGTAEASDPLTAWRGAGFDDSGWPAGAMPFGYGDAAEEDYGTTLDDMQNSYTSVFLRKRFTVLNPALVTMLTLSATYDDGFLAWINGEEIARVNVAGESGTFVACNAAASANAERLACTVSVSGKDLPPLLEGTNVLAVQAFNRTLASSDLFIDLQLALAQGPFVAGDADRDGMADLWEQAWLSFGQPGLGTDLDGDGLSDMAEYVAGTVPTNQASYFAVAVNPSNSLPVVSFSALKAEGAAYGGYDRYYALEYRDNLGDDNGWRAVPGYDRILGANQTVTCVTTNASGAYRGKVWLEQ